MRPFPLSPSEGPRYGSCPSPTARYKRGFDAPSQARHRWPHVVDHGRLRLLRGGVAGPTGQVQQAAEQSAGNGKQVGRNPKGTRYGKGQGRRADEAAASRGRGHFEVERELAGIQHAGFETQLDTRGAREGAGRVQGSREAARSNQGPVRAPQGQTRPTDQARPQSEYPT